MSKQLDSYNKKVRPRHKDKVIAHADVRSSDGFSTSGFDN